MSKTDQNGAVGARSPGSGLLKQHKPEQGKWTRRGTFIGIGILVAWCGLFVDQRLSGYQDIQAWWSLLITPGIPILLMVVLGTLGYWASFVNRNSSDFMIATEGEMKKVNWSTKREVIGSTKVVITMTLLLAILLFSVDLAFQRLFSAIGVLKVG